MSILSKIQALITAANATTGESNTTLTDAVQTLVDGYGQGGGVTTQPLSVTENGTYTAPSGTAYTPVTVNVSTGSGVAKKTGSFTLASDYTYANSAANAYTGSILVDTGLSKIESLIVWSEEWEDDTETANCFGMSLGFNNAIPTNNDKAASPYQHYSGSAFIRNGTSRKYYESTLQGIIFHNGTNGVPEGKFGLRCHSASFPILAGHTIRWEAWGEE